MCENIDILEDSILKESPKLLDLLLIDRTREFLKQEQKNIIWATDSYINLGKEFESEFPILPTLITGKNGRVIQPRSTKQRSEQQLRTKNKAEVFTPSWICNAQNNLIDNEWFGAGYENQFNTEKVDNTWTVNIAKIQFPEGKTWRDYVRDVRLEITCGEAPYLVSPYDTTTGESIPVLKRIGLLDRKLRIVGENTETEEDWLKYAKYAVQSVYGYEWQGDNILLARENVLFTAIDYYKEKFSKEPAIQQTIEFAEIIAWNIWQMDGLKCVLPNSCHDEIEKNRGLFPELETPNKIKHCPGCSTNIVSKHNGHYCIIKDWFADGEPQIAFYKLIKP